MPLDASRAKVGTRLQARVAGPWSNGSCELRTGALVEGHVSLVQHRSKTDKRSELHVIFDDAECNRQKPTPLNLILMALVGPAGNSGTNVADVPVQGYGGNTAAPNVEPAPTSGLRSVEGATQVNRYLPDATRAMPKEWRPGMVVGLPNMNLIVGTGTDGGSIVWAMNTDARLEGQTTLILLPAK